MITIKLTNGHLVHVLPNTSDLPKLETGEGLVGIAECAICGVSFVLTCDNPLPADACEDDRDDHLLDHLSQLIGDFDFECKPDGDDTVLDWTDQTTTAN